MHYLSDILGRSAEASAYPGSWPAPGQIGESATNRQSGSMSAYPDDADRIHCLRLVVAGCRRAGEEHRFIGRHRPPIGFLSEERGDMPLPNLNAIVERQSVEALPYQTRTLAELMRRVRRTLYYPLSIVRTLRSPERSCLF